MSTVAPDLPPPPRPGEIVRGPSPSRPPRWWRVLARWMARGSVLAAGAVWVADGGLRQLMTPEASIGSLAMLSGLLAAAVALVQIMLMGRLPFIERSFGQGELAHLHRFVGVVLAGLVIAHVAAVAFARPTAGLGQAVIQLAHFTATQPTLTLAAAGAVLLLVIAGISVGPVRRRFHRALNYERWHQIHLAAYLAVLLSIPHQLVFGDVFQQSQWLRAYWLCSFVLVYSCVLIFRIGLPLWRSWYYHPLVTDVIDEGHGVTTLHFKGQRHNLNGLRFQAGQFGIFRFRDRQGWITGHPISVSADPQSNHSDYELRITIKDVGGHRRWVNMPLGTRVHIEGPYGRLTDAVRTQHKVALLAAGTGITPLRALLEGLDGLEVPEDRAPGAVLLYRVSHENEVLFREELDDLALKRAAQVRLLVGHQGSRDSWLPEDQQHVSDFHALLCYIPDIIHRDVYICGPQDWMRAVERAAIHAGVPRKQLHFERFNW
ncbi:MAG: ferric reductase-like transmembrane domain-containing protein [Dermatophilaceae bacterium]